LDKNWKLPNLVGVSICKVDEDRVILFGGRNNTIFFNDVYVIQLHPDISSKKTEINSKIIELESIISSANPKNYELLR